MTYSVVLGIFSSAESSPYSFKHCLSNIKSASCSNIYLHIYGSEMGKNKEADLSIVSREKEGNYIKEKFCSLSSKTLG